MPLPSFLGPLVPLQSPHKITGSPIGSGQARVLNFQIQTQQHSNWCWAATTASVSDFYQNPAAWTQCQVAAACLFRQCCASPTPCDVVFTLDGPLKEVSHLKNVVPSAITAQAVHSEINSGRVVCCHISWPGTLGGHFVAISGYDTGTNDLLIEDSLTGTHQLPYATFKSAYAGNGVWDYTYCTQQ